MSWGVVTMTAPLTGTFWDSLPLYFGKVVHFHAVSPAGFLPLPFGGHLWFLQHLFLISLPALPVLRYLRSENGRRSIDKLAGWCGRRGGILLFLLPILLVRIGLRSFFGDVEFPLT